MDTPWTSLVSATNPLPEYPRPQLTRPDWLNLNGTWQFDKAEVQTSGDPLSTPPIGRDLSQTVLVPFPIESNLSTVMAKDIRSMWYRRTLQIPESWQGRQIQLNFGAANWRTVVWLNGHFVGTHTGAYDAFSFDITPHLGADMNELIIGVHSPLESGGIPLGKQRESPHDIFYTASSGIWQTVWLEPTNLAHITRLDVTPDVANSQLHLIVRGAGITSQSVELAVSTGGTEIARGLGRVDAPITVGIPNAQLWSPDNPVLYDLQVTLTGPGGGDTVGSYFGMRSISLGMVDGFARPLLNGEFVFQLGTLDQGFWPDGLYTAPTDDALMFDLQQHKNLGFNTVRKHMKVEPARWYYWADTLGLLVWQDMPALPLFPPDPGVAADLSERSNFEQELHRIVDQLRSFTSIVQWQPFNESWRPFDRRRIAAEVKGWDPTRLVDIDSGGLDRLSDPADRLDDQIVNGQCISGPGDCNDTHSYPGPDPLRPSCAPRAAVLGEFGASGMVVSDHAWPGTGFTLDPCMPLYTEKAKLTARYVEQITRVRELIDLQGLSAAIYTQLTDVENESNGLWTYDRKVLKVDAAQVLNANLTARALTVQQHVFYRGQIDGAVNHVWWDKRTLQLYSDRWQPNPAVPRAQSAAGDPATLVWPNQQHVFYRSADGAINHIWWDSRTQSLYSDQWLPNPRVNTQPAAGDPATMVWPNQQHVFYRSADGAINHIWWDSRTQSLYSDQWLPNPRVNTQPAAGDPATLVWPTEQHVFYRSADGAINHIWWDSVSQLLYSDQWQPNPAAPMAESAAGDPATLVWPNQQHIFYRGPMGAINHIWWDAVTFQLYSDQWLPNPRVNTQPAAGDPATLVWPNEQHVFYRSADGAINHIWWDSRTQSLYSDQWQPNPAVPKAPPAAGDPVTTVTANQQHVFYRGFDGSVNHIWWDASTRQLYSDQWASAPQDPIAAGDPATMISS